MLTVYQTSRTKSKNVKNVKNDHYGCPKNQDLFGEAKADSSWICSSYPFRHKTKLHCVERKAKVYEDWAMQHLYL